MKSDVSRCPLPVVFRYIEQHHWFRYQLYNTFIARATGRLRVRHISAFIFFLEAQHLHSSVALTLI
jgi:hypothetical protein